MGFEQRRGVGNFSPQRQPDTKCLPLFPVVCKDSIDDRIHAAAIAFDQSQETADHCFVDCRQKIILATEVMRDEAAGDVRLLADTLDGETKNAALRQAGKACLDQQFAAIFAGDSAETW